MSEQERFRYQVCYPADADTLPGASDDLEEAGRIYLATPGASDIYDAQEGRWINPESEIACVGEAMGAYRAGERTAPRRKVYEAALRRGKRHREALTEARAIFEESDA